jgi:hypothetical protein
MRKTILTLFLATCLTPLSAQTESTLPTSSLSSEWRSEELRNIVRLGYGIGVLTSKVIDFNKTYSHASILPLTVDYEHVWDSGMGCGINASQGYLKATGNNEFYVGASFVAAYTFSRGWRLSASTGLGLAVNDFGVGGSKSGLGSLSTAYISYKLLRHWGVALGARASTSSYRRPKDWEGRYGATHYDLSVGVTYGW